ncbi:hypothetical protein [Cellulomonas sp. PSBB021]|uniref:hypothetical protein n=1 Tax=Cellulomonas sp. PSBB021 TaxID=2003551 RepID=UPI000B8D4B10|nr:hypothetical protein [Cellulomonas sp. PSBB021]ASR55852.1 hypothetical protein CBP52_12920 [Cellulomonas sp. PSBB021]
MVAAAAFGLVVALVGAVVVWSAVHVDTTDLDGAWFAYSPMPGVVSDGNMYAQHADGSAVLGLDPWVWVGVALVGAGGALTGLFGGLTLARRARPDSV